MLTKTIATLFIAIVCSIHLLAQTQAPPPRKLPAKRTTSAIKIDGLLNDAAWKDAPAALGYTEFRPTPFRKEDSATRTEVYMLYNDEGIYFGGYCYERTKDSISSELTGRDGFGNNDYIGFIFDTYDDKINAFEYFTTPLGEQMDAKMSPNPNGNSEDFSWNAVWKSASVIHNDGWSFEMFIPFSAIRFSKKAIQDWGMNITRRRQKTQQQVTWNPIDVNINGFLTQEGFWTGLENIKP
ncbi:MAG TPA: carbohydrate binding family 9 domain-containing protein, partial [Chitinophagaceae bacterium]|nr:carbohydrate binding family 9 domain-containing protein [Chitinophagaceae bacterium]